jgi:predicted fused transcriptional regulator/phosphomethylpyrimidine kinase
LYASSDPHAVDAVADRGGMGKEPMIRILATSAGELEEKLKRICAALPPGGIDTAGTLP